MIRIRSGNTLVKVYPPKDKADGRFTIAYYTTEGTRKVESRSTKTEAMARATEIAERIDSGRLDEAELSRSEVDEYRYAQSKLKPLGIPLTVAINEYLASRQANAVKQIKVADAVDELLTLKQKAGASRSYMHWLRRYLRGLGTTFHNCTMEAITTAELDRFIDQTNTVGRSRVNFRLAFVTLWRWAAKRGYVLKGSTVAEDVSKTRYVSADIEIFTPAEMIALLRSASPKDRLYAAIRGFAGVRDAELGRPEADRRLHWSDILWENRSIQINASKSKTRSRRVIPISDNLWTFLEPHKGETGPICKENSPRILKRLATSMQAMGYHWKRNGLRRSYASYLYAETENEYTVASRTGHSPQMLFSHYRGLATKSAAKEWFSITPAMLEQEHGTHQAESDLEIESAANRFQG